LFCTSDAFQAKSFLVPTCLLPTTDQNVNPPQPNALEKAIIVRGTREKIPIHDAYEEYFGSDSNYSIVFKKKDKIQQDPGFILSCMRQALDI
jgi:hypothetical protein